MKKSQLLSTCLLTAAVLMPLSGPTFARAPSPAVPPRPRMVVVVSIDQFRFDYLYRLADANQQQGIYQRVATEGANFAECRHGHAFTITGPGHSVMLTGTYPGRTGIIDNDWYDVRTGKDMYCVGDPDRPLVGTSSNPEKGISPKNLMVGTLGDSMKLTDSRARVFGVAMKDRAAVLMTGHSADGAFWYDDNSGNWITSTYYRDQLPDYLRVLNESDAAERYLGKSWKLARDAGEYLAQDQQPVNKSAQLDPATFERKMPDKVDAKYYKAVALSPFGNEQTLAAAKLLIEAEKLGADDIADLLAINLSSNDYVGHAFGPNSLEVQDMIYRTDTQLGELAAWIDERVGRDRWVLAITSDHGVGPVPEYAATLHVPSGRNATGGAKALGARLEAQLRAALGTPANDQSYIRHVDEQNVFFNRGIPELVGDKLAEAQRVARDALLSEPVIQAAFTREQLIRADASRGLALRFQRAFSPQRSGDVLYALAPYNIAGGSAATHGSPWEYDSHVPLLLWGAGVNAGVFNDEATPAHLAPTLARILRVNAPSSCETPALHAALR